MRNLDAGAQQLVGVMAQKVMAYIVMSACRSYVQIVMAYIVMAARRSYGPDSYGLSSYGAARWI